jgi:hypothetical protein
MRIGNGATKSRAGGSFSNAAMPASLTRITTASNSTDGPPSILRCADRRVPSLASTPPTVGATRSTVAPASVAAVSTVLRHEGALLGLGEIFRHAVEDEAADRRHRQNILRDQFCRVENVEIEAVGEFLVKGLEA